MSPVTVGQTITDRGLTREVLWTDGRRVQVRSTWMAKGKPTSHTFLLAIESWCEWADRALNLAEAIRAHSNETENA